MYKMRLVDDIESPKLDTMEVDSPHRPEPMSTNTTAENVIEIMSSPVAPALKRKGEDRPRHEGKENEAKDKRVKLESASNGSPSPKVELKGRQLVYNQAPAPWDINRRNMISFSAYLLDHEDSSGRLELTEFPPEYTDLVVVSGHELASPNENAFVKAIHQSFRKMRLYFPLELLTPLVSKHFKLCHYGLLPSDFPSSSKKSKVKIPAALQIKRWEAIEPKRWFQAEWLAAVAERKAEREAVREEVVRMLKAMDDVEAHDLLKGEKELKMEGKLDVAPAVERERGRLEQSPSVSVSRASREGTAATTESRRSASPSKKSKMTPEEEETARLKKEAADARKAEKAEKKAARDLEQKKKEEEKAKLEAEKAEKKAARDLEQKKKEEEKAKLEAVHVKQANMFGSFFKPKPAAAAANDAASTSASPIKRAATPELSDFHQVFRPHVVRPGTKWATFNRWAAAQGTEGERSTSGANSEQGDHLKRHGGHCRSKKRKLPDGIKSGSPYPTVGEVWLAHQEAADPRKVLSQLRKSHKYPWKLLAFDQQARPPYSGTFTKRSAVVGPRTPFAQDPMFDYTYDSGDDWEEEEGGEDVDDSGEAKPEEEEDVDSDEEEEDEFDDWLDDTEDAGYAPVPVEDDDDPLVQAGPSSRQERLQMNVEKKADKPRKVVKITPTWRGPIWETEIGKNEDFAEYRLQLLNDTPDSLDPFTYISSEPSQAYKTTMSTISMGPSTIPCLIATQATTVVAAPPSAPATTDPSTTEPSATTKPRPSGPKIGFPTTHLSELYKLIHGNTKIKPDLVSQLRQHFENITSKAAIEAKVKEVAFREGKTKDSQWKVKPEAWVAAGLVQPVEAPTPSLFSKPAVV